MRETELAARRTPPVLQGRKRGKGSSLFIGVSLGTDPQRFKPWRALLAGKTLGYFHTEIEAARAYDRAAVEKYGSEARTNFPTLFPPAPPSETSPAAVEAARENGKLGGRPPKYASEQERKEARREQQAAHMRAKRAGKK